MHNGVYFRYEIIKSRMARLVAGHFRYTFIKISTLSLVPENRSHTWTRLKIELKFKCNLFSTKRPDNSMLSPHCNKPEYFIKLSPRKQKVLNFFVFCTTVNNDYEPHLVLVTSKFLSRLSTVVTPNKAIFALFAPESKNMQIRQCLI